MRAQKQKGESLHSLMDVPTLYSQSRPIWAFYYARPTVRFVCLFLRNANVYNESWSGRDSASGPEAYLGACIEGLTIRRIVNLMLVKLINYILSPSSPLLSFRGWLSQLLCRNLGKFAFGIRIIIFFFFSHTHTHNYSSQIFCWIKGGKGRGAKLNDSDARTLITAADEVLSYDLWVFLESKDPNKVFLQLSLALLRIHLV